MSKKSFRQRLNEAMRQEMERDPTVILMGESHCRRHGLQGRPGCLGRRARREVKGCSRNSVASGYMIRRSAKARSLVRLPVRRSMGFGLLLNETFVDFFGVCGDQIVEPDR